MDGGSPGDEYWPPLHDGAMIDGSSDRLALFTLLVAPRRAHPITSALDERRMDRTRLKRLVKTIGLSIVCLVHHSDSDLENSLECDRIADLVCLMCLLDE